MEEKLFLVFVDDDWNTTVRSEGQLGAVQKVQDMYREYGHRYETIRALEIKDPIDV